VIKEEKEEQKRSVKDGEHTFEVGMTVEDSGVDLAYRAIWRWEYCQSNG
jgi:hypothetical protein